MTEGSGAVILSAFGFLSVMASILIIAGHSRLTKCSGRKAAILPANA